MIIFLQGSRLLYCDVKGVWNDELALQGKIVFLFRTISCSRPSDARVTVFCDRDSLSRPI